MKKEPYLPLTDAGKAIWLTNFAARLAVHAATLGIAPAVVTQTEQDSENFNAIISNITVFREYSKQVTEYKNLMRDGNPDGSSIGTIAPAPATLVFANPPVGNIFGRVTQLVQNIKSNPACTPAIAEDLGIIGAETNTDYSTYQPEFKLEMVAQQVLIKWKKLKSDGVNIYKAVDNGSWAKLDFDGKPNYLDTSDLPPVGTTQVWKYKLVYVKDEAEIGTFSGVMEITVTGIV